METESKNDANTASMETQYSSSKTDDKINAPAQVKDVNVIKSEPSLQTDEKHLVLDCEQETLDVGNIRTIRVCIQPIGFNYFNYDYPSGNNKWTTSNPQVATIIPYEPNQAIVDIEVVGVGEATITVVNENGMSTSAKIIGIEKQ